MKKLILGMLLSVGVLSGAQAKTIKEILQSHQNPTQSATQQGSGINEDECAIWLCLPGGFPEGCDKAYSAMIKRLEEGKSSLPNFASCTVDGNDHGLSYTQGRAYKIEPHQICRKSEPVSGTVMLGPGGQRKYQVRCTKWEDVEGGWKDTNACGQAGMFCTKQATLTRMFQDGKLISESTIDEKNLPVGVTGVGGWVRPKGSTEDTRWLTSALSNK